MFRRCVSWFAALRRRSAKKKSAGRVPGRRHYRCAAVHCSRRAFTAMVVSAPVRPSCFRWRTRPCDQGARSGCGDDGMRARARRDQREASVAQLSQGCALPERPQRLVTPRCLRIARTWSLSLSPAAPLSPTRAGISTAAAPNRRSLLRMLRAGRSPTRACTSRRTALAARAARPPARVVVLGAASGLRLRPPRVVSSSRPSKDDASARANTGELAR